MATDNDEWTLVRGKKGGRRAEHQVVGQSNRNRVDNDATLESLTKEYTSRERVWRRMQARTQLRELLSRMYLKDRPHIDKAVCIGLGTLTTPNLENRNRSLEQLAVFVDIVDYLSTAYDAKIEMLLQEPMLSALDEAFLISRGIIVVQYSAMDPAIDALGPVEQYVDEHTFVADLYTEVSVSGHLAKLKMPLLLSALPERTLDDPYVKKHNKQDIVRLLKDRYLKYKFPRADEMAPNFKGLYFCALHLDEVAEEKT